VNINGMLVLVCLPSSPSDGDDHTIDAVALLTEQPIDVWAMLASSVSESRSESEYCVALLASLGLHDGDNVLALHSKPALYVLIADGSPYAGKEQWSSWCG
jgi:hypothetical protein